LPDGADPLLLAFRGPSLVHRDNGPLVPTVAEAAAAGLVVNDVLPLGTVEGRAVAFASLPADTKLPDGYAASSLRRLMVTLEGSLVGAAALASQLAAFEETTRFCGGCGGPLVRKAGERAKRCEKDDRDIYPQVAPCVIVLIHDGPRVVLARAPRLPAGMYSLVAGFVEPGETLEDCVRREVKEEVGLEVGELTYVASQPWPFPSQLMVGFFARYQGGDIVPDPSEIDEAAWFDVADLPPVPPPLSVARFLIDEYVRLASNKVG
jgi:NAD+ diphosphatase